jgi:hypothetical protein
MIKKYASADTMIKIKSEETARSSDRAVFALFALHTCGFCDSSGLREFMAPIAKQTYPCVNFSCNISGVLSIYIN